MAYAIIFEVTPLLGLVDMVLEWVHSLQDCVQF